MDTTSKIKLCLISREDDMVVGDFLQKYAGANTSSNMELIDDAIHDLRSTASGHLTPEMYDPDSEIIEAGGLKKWFESVWTPEIRYEVSPVSDIKCIAGSKEAYIKWSDPGDYIESGMALGKYAGTVLVRNSDHFPIDNTDGEIVLDSTVQNAYANTYYRDPGLENGIPYYYGLFPYTINDIYTVKDAGQVQVTPNPVYISGITGISVKNAGNGKLSIMWSDPTSDVISDGVTLATWKSTIVVLKTEDYAISKDDPDVVFSFSTTTRDKYATSSFTVDGLENGIKYYISFFIETNNGDICIDEAALSTGTPNKFKISTIPSQSGTSTYTGNTISPIWSNYNSTMMTISGTTSAINAGVYSATFTPKNDYCWNDGSADPISVSWTISKSSNHGFALSATNVEIGTDSLSVDITAYRNGDGKITAVVSDKNIASASVNGTTITISGVNNTDGNTIVYVYLGEGTNYTGSGSPIIINVTADYLPVVGTPLNDCTWDQINTITQRGLAEEYFSVGDIKAIELNGTVGQLTLSGVYYALILGFNHNGVANTIDFSLCADQNATPLAFIDSSYHALSDGYYNTRDKCFSINHWGIYSSSILFGTTCTAYTYGGWAASDIRYDILGSTDVAPSGYGDVLATGRTGYDPSENCTSNPVEGSLMALLPAELRVNMKAMEIYTHNAAGDMENSVETNVTKTIDYLPLMAEYEVMGVRQYANSYEQNYQKQYEYFSDGNSALRYSHTDSTSKARYYLRSPYSLYTFLYMTYSSETGLPAVGSMICSEALGLAPIFRI